MESLSKSKNKIIKVTCALIEKDNKVLVVQRSEKMKLPLKWEFPGGKLEEDELEEECIKREIFEELRIEIEPVLKLSHSLHHYNEVSIELIPFVSKYLSGDFKLIEHQQMLWLDKNELTELDWAEADIPIVNEYLNL